MAAVGDVLSVVETRRIALNAQGFGEPLGRGDLRTAIRWAGVLQLDSVNVLCRSHYLPVYSRVGNYPRAALDELSWGAERELFE
ncbi:MAG: winged helix-turn-helix domain-containing protein, partial [Kribbellaceae bacterium]|nr:winged helix-turn-helix domain-containing protein [Kribbellaceae bacterium]